MDQVIHQRLRLVRHYLDSDPRSLTAAKLREGWSGDQQVPDEGSAYFEFLKESDGARFGIIDLFDHALLPERNSDIEEFDTGLWLCVGQVLYEPLLIDRRNGNVAILKRDSGEIIKIAASFDAFLENYAIGPRYSELLARPAEDRWSQVLRSLAIIIS